VRAELRERQGVAIPLAGVGVVAPFVMAPGFLATRTCIVTTLPLRSNVAASPMKGLQTARNGAPLRYPVAAMSDAPDRPPPKQADERRRLDSWKEIAAYLGRGVRTIQRWEREEGLPVHRLAQAKRGSVFADRAELADWSKTRQIAAAIKSPPGRLLYYLPTVDIRNRVVARAFDPRDGRVEADPIDVLTLSETIVPAMISAAAPIVAGDQIVFLLGNYRGDIWMLDLQVSG
jgi:hypothetical protein